MLKFIPMNENDFLEFWKIAVDQWKTDMENAGLMEKNTSYEEAEKYTEKILPKGMNTTGHKMMNIFDDDKKIGSIWFELRERVGLKEIYLWDIIIDEEYRSKGYGKATMSLLEEFAKNEGAVRISLNVFGSNRIARKLYTKIGYYEAAITMIKYL